MVFGVSYFQIGLDDVAWIAADPHIGHKNMVRKGWRDEEYDKIFLSWWANHVEKDDYVFILGDWCLGKNCYAGDLPGIKILVKGNHDVLGKGKIFKYGFDYITDYVLARVFVKPGVAKWVLMSHKRVPLKYIRDLPVKVQHNIHGHSHSKRPLYSRDHFYINADIAYLGYGMAEIRELVWDYRDDF